MIIKTQNRVTKEDQYWELSFRDVNLYNTSQIISAYGEVPNLHMIVKEIQRIDALFINDITLIPLTGPVNCDIVESRTQHRGYVDDPNPWMIHNKPVKECMVRMFGNVDIGRRPTFFPYFGSKPITKSQQDKLREWFMDGLSKVRWKDMLLQLKEETKNLLISYMKKDIIRLQKQLFQIDNTMLGDLQQ